jgi:hypothetical protein
MKANEESRCTKGMIPEGCRLCNFSRMRNPSIDRPAMHVIAVVQLQQYLHKNGTCLIELAEGIALLMMRGESAYLHS